MPKPMTMQDDQSVIPSQPEADLSPRVGVSRCLLGDNVRVNGGHSRDKWIVNTLRAHAQIVPVCPEVELGMPTPRPPLRLVRDPEGERVEDARLVESKSGKEWTDEMTAFAQERSEQLASEQLDGFILKKDSPTCGVFRVKVYDHNNSPSRMGRGVFAEALMARHPNLPVEEEGRLNDPALRESFLVRVHAHARWRRFRRDDSSGAGWVSFHARHKMLLLAADPAAYRRLGRLVAAGAGGPTLDAERLDAYEAGLMAALTRTVSPGRHVNVLQHLLGFCKTELRAEEKLEVARTLEHYVDGILPRAVPVTLVRYLLLEHEAAPWAREQLYLDPYPAALAGGRSA